MNDERIDKNELIRQKQGRQGVWLIECIALKFNKIYQYMSLINQTISSTRSLSLSHTHTHTRARTHAHTRTYTRTRARTHCLSEHSGNADKSP